MTEKFNLLGFLKEHKEYLIDVENYSNLLLKFAIVASVMTITANMGRDDLTLLIMIPFLLWVGSGFLYSYLSLENARK